MCGHQQGNSKSKSCKDPFPKKLRLQDKPKRKERGRMLCPNCQRQMSYKNETFRGIDFGGTAEDHELMEAYEEYKCPRCGIERINGKWRIPESLKPSPKQVNAILFINARLNTGIEPLTKSQCWRDTQKHFEAAKNAYLYHMY